MQWWGRKLAQNETDYRLHDREENEDRQTDAQPQRPQSHAEEIAWVRPSALNEHSGLGGTHA